MPHCFNMGSDLDSHASLFHTALKMVLVSHNGGPMAAKDISVMYCALQAV